jgi:hypothetical protein
MATSPRSSAVSAAADVWTSRSGEPSNRRRFPTYEIRGSRSDSRRRPRPRPRRPAHPAHAPAQEQGYSLVVFVSLEPDAQLVMRPDMLAADPPHKAAVGSPAEEPLPVLGMGQQPSRALRPSRGAVVPPAQREVRGDQAPVALLGVEQPPEVTFGQTHDPARRRLAVTRPVELDEHGESTEREAGQENSGDFPRVAGLCDPTAPTRYRCPHSRT